MRQDALPLPIHFSALGRGIFWLRAQAGQQRHVPRDHDAVETVIYKNQEALKKLREGFHRSPPSDGFS
jgi:hypothetical protein